MASANYNYDKSKAFFSTEEVDDATFLRSGRRAYDSSTVEERHQQLLQERRKIEERTVQSSFRSVSLLHESEQIGAATAEELARQREQLQNTEVKLDEINQTLRVSQKHIQGIKSVFGSIRNYFSSGPNKDGANKVPHSASDKDLSSKDANNQQQPESKAKLTQILETTKNEQTTSTNSVHPAERFRSDEPLSSRDVDSILDRNLDDMGNAISRLKNLGLDLNKEIDVQNSMIDRIANKTEDVDFKVQSQNKDMNKILKK